MAYRHNDLFAQLASFQALHAAALRAARGKRRAPAVTRFLMNLETNMLALERELLSGAYTLVRRALGFQATAHIVRGNAL